MRRLLFLSTFCLAISSIEASWSYKKLPDDPHSDPARWTSLGQCAGQHQSPIDIQTHEVVRANATGHLTLFQPLGTSCSGSLAERSHHGVKVLMDDCRVLLRSDWLGGVHYLLQMHMHTHSEHYIDGKPNAMELHIVFKSLKPHQGPLVIAVMYNIGEESDLLDPLISNLHRLPRDGSTVSLKDFKFTYNTDKKDYYEYMGSFTTPPCTEKVHWLVQVQPETISMPQLHALEAMLKGQQNGEVNVRPLQPLNGRRVIQRTIQSCATAEDGADCLEFEGRPSHGKQHLQMKLQALVVLLLVVSGTLACALYKVRQARRPMAKQCPCSFDAAMVASTLDGSCTSPGSPFYLV